MGIYNTDTKQLDSNAGSLADLILGSMSKRDQSVKDAGLKAEGIARNQAAAEDLASRQGLKPGKYAITASENGMSVNPEHDDLFTKLMMLKDKEDSRNDKDLTTLGNRVEKEGIPATMSAIANLEKGTSDPTKGAGGIVTNPDYDVKSAGPIANALPQWAKNMGESVGLMPQGSSNEAALMQRLMNFDIKNLSGTAVSNHEMGRQNVEKGLAVGGDSSLVKLGIKQMTDAINSSAQNIVSSSRPGVINTFRKQGGKLTLEDYLGKSPQADSGGQEDAERARYEQLKAKHRGGR